MAPKTSIGQPQCAYPKLVAVLNDFYKCPASTAGVKRQRKAKKPVNSPQKGRLGEEKANQQVAVAYYDPPLVRTISQKRLVFESVTFDVSCVYEGVPTPYPLKAIEPPDDTELEK